MVVKGVAVDSAGLHDVLDRDPVQGLFVQQGDKGFFNGFLVKFGMESTSYGGILCGLCCKTV